MANKFVFPADGSQLQAEAKKSSTELRVMKAELQRLEAQSKATHRELVLQAKAAGASSEDLRKLQQKQFGEQLAFNSTRKQITADVEASGRKMVKSEEDKARAVSHVTDELKRQRAEAERLAKTPIREQHLEPTDRQKAGALVRGGGLRSAEAFAATIPGFASFASAIFPLVGGAALLADLSTKVGELREKLREAREAGMRLREGFEGINAPIETSVDTLRKQNAELDISIARLLHKPENGLKLAIAEAALEVDHLADRARSAYAEIQKLVREQKVGFLGGFLNQGDTSEAANLVEGGFRDISELSRDRKDAARKFGANSQQARDANAAEAARRSRLRSDLSELRTKVNGYEEVDDRRYSEMTGGMVGEKVKRKYSDIHGDQTAQRNIISGALDVLDNQDDEDAERKGNAQRVGQQKQIELHKSELAAAREAGNKAKEAARKAAEEQRKGWENELAAMESSGKTSADAIHSFWVNKSNETKAGTENYQLAEKKGFETLRALNVEKARSLEEGLKMREAFSREGMKDAVGLVMPGINANAKGTGEAARTLQALQEQQERAKFTVAEANVQYALQAGSINKADYALQLQTLHTMQYEAALRRLQMQRDAIQEGPEAQARRNEIDTRIGDLNEHRAVDMMRDQAELAGTSWSEALKRANREWVLDARDSTKQVVALQRQLLDGLNSNLAEVMQHIGERNHRHLGRELGNAVGGTFRGIGGSLMNMGLQRAESTVLGRFGVAKADGSRSNPWNVYVVNPVDGKGSGSLLPSPATISGMVGKRSSDGLMQGIGGIAADAAMSFLPGGALLGSLFGGFRAFGGGIDEGKSYIVGEKGPEVFSPGRSGYITPNNRLKGMFGDVRPNITVDARGAHDPAAVEAAVHRGIAAAAPHIVSASLTAHKEQAARRPSGSR